MALTGKTRQELIGLIGDLDVEDLREAEGLVHELRRTRIAAKRLQFHAGQRVEFTSKTRGVVQGVVTRIASVNVLVDAGEMGQWRVSPGLLRPVDGAV